jgi:deoxyribodipyrimidine photo-lyase
MIYGFVKELKKELISLGLDLKIFYGKPVEIFKNLPLLEFEEVVASGDYDSYAKQRDTDISQLIHFRYINDTYFLKPRELLKADGSPYLVFTPFYKKARLLLNDKDITPYSLAKCSLYPHDYADDFKLNGFESFDEQTTSASKKLQLFKTKLKDYKDKRDYLDADASSQLSVALRFGLVSLREVYTALVHLDGAEDFIRQLLFRDFYAYLLFHFPDLEMQNYKGKFNGVENKEKYERFISASTGVPIVDAGVRELLQTGNMHNRVRMVVASFFTKDLLLPWQWGERFFAAHLNDYDTASNILSWQWSAGTGIDPQPYFRVFNPYLQSKKFDHDAHYIKTYIPELKDIDAKLLHKEEYLLKTQIKCYPMPMLEHKIAAKIAIESFKNN